MWKSLFFSVTIIFILLLFLFIRVGFGELGSDSFFNRMNTDSNIKDNTLERKLSMNQFNKEKNNEQKMATFAGGCFWCVEKAFESIDGVTQVLSGFSGGEVKNPTYEQVMTGTTGHYEVIQVYYNPQEVSYDTLLEVFWQNIDPTDEIGQFADKGPQYRTAIFYHDKYQQDLAHVSLEKLESSKKFDKPIITKVLKFDAFYKAEDYHQDYYKKMPEAYGRYFHFSGRYSFLKEKWGKPTRDKLKKTYLRPDDEDIKDLLTPEQYDITQKDGTERPFENAYWNNKEEGIYVDIVSGEPLFSSRDKFESGTGWPCFSRSIDDYYITEHTDSRYGMQRIEVRSRVADSHLGHVFPDGPGPDGIRYCINSAAIRFIPKENMESEGYSSFNYLFD